MTVRNNTVYFASGEAPESRSRTGRGLGSSRRNRASGRPPVELHRCRTPSERLRHHRLQRLLVSNAGSGAEWAGGAGAAPSPLGRGRRPASTLTRSALTRPSKTSSFFFVPLGTRLLIGAGHAIASAPRGTSARARQRARYWRVNAATAGRRRVGRDRDPRRKRRNRCRRGHGLGR